MKKLFALVLVSLVVAAPAQALWEPPTANPPNNNRPRPINVGPDFQSKSNGVNFNGSVSVGGIIDEANIDADMHIQGSSLGNNDFNIIVDDDSPEFTFETDIATYNWRTSSNENSYLNGFQISKGVQDDDATDDTWTTLMNIDGVTNNTTFFGDVFADDFFLNDGRQICYSDGSASGGGVCALGGGTQNLLETLNNGSDASTYAGPTYIGGSVGINTDTITPSMELDISGDVIADAYYDRNDSTYFLNPNGPSVLYGDMTYRGPNNYQRSDSAFQFVNEAGVPQDIYAANLLVSNTYSDNTNLPPNGIWAKGPIISDQDQYIKVGDDNGAAYMSAGGAYAHFALNSYYDGSNWQVNNPGASQYFSLYQQTEGNNYWYDGGYGTSPTWKERMRLTKNGNLYIWGGRSNLCVRKAYNLGTYYCPDTSYTVVSAQNSSGFVTWPPPTTGYIVCCKFVECDASDNCSYPD